VRVAPVACFAVLSLWASLAGPPRARENGLKQWLDGPVHYIMTPEEIKEFKAQTTDSDRAAFVERFWRKRDPTPDTLANEYRSLFWNRVKEADEKFLDSSKPGWKTDRGKIYILYGPPDEFREDPNAKVGSGPSDGAGLIRWIYLKPGGRRDVDPVVYVPFVRDVTGEYRLSYDPELSSPFFNWASIDDKRTAGLDAFVSDLGHNSKSPLGVMLDLGKMQEVPPPEKFVLDSVESVETFAYAALPLSLDRFRLDNGGMLAVVTIAIPGPEGGEVPALLARFSHVGTGPNPHLLGEGSFRVEGEGLGRVAQGRVALEPGAWDATVLSVDPQSGLSRIFRGRVAPLPVGPALALSDVVLARSLEPLPYATQASYDAPFIVGGFHVEPHVSSTVARGDPVRLFYEIYAGQAPYRVAYQLQGQENDGRWTSLGPPQERDATTRGQGFELSTGDSWPFGSYRMRIHVSDAAGAGADALASWVLVEKESPPQPETPAPIVREP